MIYKTFFSSPRRHFEMGFSDIESLRRQMERLFDVFGDRRQVSTGPGVFPALNITEDLDFFYLNAELPGVKSADLDLNITANQVILAGERKITEEVADARYHRREREAGKFSRTISLPGDIDPDNATASMVDGVLTVTIPKSEKAKPRQITVQ